MKRLALAFALATLTALALAASAQAEFGINGFDVAFTDSKGGAELRAGAHPFAQTLSFGVDTEKVGGKTKLSEAAKDLEVAQVEGLAGNPTAVPPCSNADFLTAVFQKEKGVGGGSFQVPDCPDSSAVGEVMVKFVSGGKIFSAVYDLAPSPGHAARLGFWSEGVPVTINLGVSESPPYNIVGGPRDVSQVLEVSGSEFTIWGVPADPVHDPLRGHCLDLTGESSGDCKANISAKPFLTMPRSCKGPLLTHWEADSWVHPGQWIEGAVPTHDEAGNPRGMSGCGALDFGPKITARPTSKAATSPTGLDFSLDVDQNEGLANPAGTAAADIAKTVVTLPEGMTVNPSQAEGLEVCSEAELEGESAFSAPGDGCPEASKIGTIEVETPLLEGQVLQGSLYVAKPYENPMGSLIALYVVIKDPELGISVIQPLRVTPDPDTGQLITTAEEMPELPFSHFRLHFREGGRSPLITPPDCGPHTVSAELTPSSGAAPITTTSTFQVISGPNEGPCPPGGVRPFHPGFEAGSVNNQAKAYSPFDMRLTRKDGEQEMTKFSAVLPPGVLGKIAGLSKCSDAAIAQAKARSGAHGGLEELERPSCPASSKIGRTLAGAGVGSQLTYVPGSLYLAGPVAGDPLSVVAITPALAGPFDAGTVVARVALTLNPVTAEVEVDGSRSDPIPHILKGIPLNLRDLRVYADRPEFTLNPTDCEPSSARATLFGSFLAPLDPSDDAPVGLSSRFQAANCAALPFRPKLDLKLKGGARRGGHPAFSATYTPRAGDANLEGLVTRLPRSAFLDQAHIRTICTRVQFAAKACPKGAEYGFIKAWTQLLDEPLEGPVYLRSSNHNLPDLVFDLHGLVDVEVATRIDSQKGGIRATVQDAPDAPISKVLLQMQGGKKGLIVNSRDLCGAVSKAGVEFSGQNGKAANAKPVLTPDCGRKRRSKRGLRHSSTRTR